MTTVKLTKQDLVFLRDMARRHWLDTHCSKQLPGSGEPLTTEELHALSWFHAVTDLLTARGFPADARAHLDDPDGEPDTE